MLHRAGRPQEALRYLAEANRIDAGCPFVTWQMGVSLVAAGGDSRLAVRALQRALGPPRAAAVGRSRRSAPGSRRSRRAAPTSAGWRRKNPYVCPVLGGDLDAVILRRGSSPWPRPTTARARSRRRPTCTPSCCRRRPPTLPLLRGLGLSLARLQRYDQAYKHLRTALEQEKPKDPFTAAYLALCGAMGKPTQPEDKPQNVAWAIRLLARYPSRATPSGPASCPRVHAEARR